MPAEKTEVVKQQELADNAKFSSKSQDYDAGEVVIVSCTNGHPAPTQACRVTLELSLDDVIWVTGDSRSFGSIEGTTNLAAFVLSAVAASGAWRHYRLAFAGAVGGAVTIAASTGQAPVPEEEKPEKPEKPGPGPAKR